MVVVVAVVMAAPLLSSSIDTGTIDDALAPFPAERGDAVIVPGRPCAGARSELADDLAAYTSATMRDASAEAPASFGDVTVREPTPHVAEVEWHRPPANFFDVELLGGILEGLAWAERRDCRAAVLCSEGKHFCAGFDFSGVGTPLGETIGALYGRAYELVCGPLPLVAAVQGSAVGGGLGLALACDLRVASVATKFSANFARLGIHHGFGLSLTLPEAVGHQRALELLSTGRRVDGAEAERIGLCDRLDDDPRAGARRLASELAEAAPLAVRAIRATQRARLVGGFRAAVEHERSEQLRLMETADFGEGVTATDERRTPRFSGR
jgi:2-(1,2-epoxy-1,2-dihydrophenyl)acetyl-CoA isomerase